MFKNNGQTEDIIKFLYMEIAAVKIVEWPMFSARVFLIWQIWRFYKILENAKFKQP